jgi:PI-3-kinase-related kinase SMG-1
MNRLSTSISMQSQYRIKLSNLSPKLATCAHLSIPIPGQEMTEIDDGLVTIQSVEPLVSMLPTKTRPKKIKFMGSDGNQCSFLCKGQEDLRVDEQISSVFRICNYMFDASKFVRQDPSLSYSLRSYTVTPISPRSGLIQWLQDPISIYSIYRSWRASKVF